MIATFVMKVKFSRHRDNRACSIVAVHPLWKSIINKLTIETIGHVPLWQHTNCGRVLLTHCYLFLWYDIDLTDRIPPSSLNQDGQNPCMNYDLEREMTSGDEKLPLLGEQSSLFCRLTCLVLKIQGASRSKQTNISVSNICRSWFSYYSLTIYIADKRKLRVNFITFQMLSVPAT